MECLASCLTPLLSRKNCDVICRCLPQNPPDKATLAQPLPHSAATLLIACGSLDVFFPRDAITCNDDPKQILLKYSNHI